MILVAQTAVAMVLSMGGAKAGQGGVRLAHVRMDMVDYTCGWATDAYSTRDPAPPAERHAWVNEGNGYLIAYGKPKRARAPAQDNAPASLAEKSKPVLPPNYTCGWATDAYSTRNPAPLSTEKRAWVNENNGYLHSASRPLRRHK